MYVLYGNENYFVNKFIKNIKNKYKNINSVFLSPPFSFDQIIDALDSGNLFAQKKIIIIKNFEFFDNNILKKDEIYIKKIINLLENSNDEIIFIVSNMKDKNNIKSNIFTNFLSNLTSLNKIKWFPCLELSNDKVPNFIIDIVQQQGGKISLTNAIKLQNKLPNNLEIIAFETEKLLQESQEITSNMIDISVSDYYIEDTFGFSNSFESNDFSSIWNKYFEKKNEDIDINVLISQISHTFILAKKIYYYLAEFKEKQIVANLLNLNIYRFKKIYKILTNYGFLKVKKIISTLSILDIEIKTGKVNPENGFEQFLIKFFK